MFVGAKMKIILGTVVTFFLLFNSVSFAAPYGAIVINAENGKVLHCEECDTKLHPAGLTKLRTSSILGGGRASPPIDNAAVKFSEKLAKRITN